MKTPPSLCLLVSLLISFGSLAALRAAEPPAKLTAPSIPAVPGVVIIEEPDTDLAKAVNKQGQKVILEALYREIGTHGAEADKFYNAVKRARGIGLMGKVAFEPGKTTITPEQVAAVKAGLAGPRLKRYFDDPTVRIAVLGYADKPDDTDANTALAKQRAERLQKIMRDEADIRNVIRPLAVRDWLLSDPTIKKREYALELWLILP